MLTYEYHCPSNGQTLQVRHGMSETLKTWGELIERAGMTPEEDNTPADAPIKRNILGGQMVRTKKSFTGPVYPDRSAKKPGHQHSEACDCHR